MSWEVFQAKGGKACKFPRATITRQGYLTINRLAADLIFPDLGGPLSFELSADFEAGLVGIMRSESLNAYRFRLHGGNYLSGVKTFLSWAGIPRSKARRYRLFKVGPLVCFRVADFIDVTKVRLP